MALLYSAQERLSRGLQSVGLPLTIWLIFWILSASRSDWVIWHRRSQCTNAQPHGLWNPICWPKSIAQLSSPKHIPLGLSWLLLLCLRFLSHYIAVRTKQSNVFAHRLQVRWSGDHSYLHPPNCFKAAFAKSDVFYKAHTTWISQIKDAKLHSKALLYKHWGRAEAIKSIMQILNESNYDNLMFPSAQDESTCLWSPR